MTPFPNTFPQEALLVMLDKVRGREVETSKLVHAAWVVTGYGLGQTIGAERTPVWGESPELSDEEAGVAIEAALAANDETNPEAKGAIGWMILLKVATKILIKVIA